MTDPKAHQLIAADYFLLANQYLGFYQILSEKIQDAKTPQPEKEALYAQSEPILQKAYEFQRLGFKALTAQLNIPATELLTSVKDATNAIKRIFRIGKVIEIATDLVAIAAIVTVPVIKPTALTALPLLVQELRNDVKDLET